MAWQDDLLPATLGGIEFLYSSVKDSGGRKDALFEFPGRERAFIEDLGPATQRFNVEAFLLGADYHVTLRDLEDVLNTAGDLVFQHPYRGEFTVRLNGGYQVTQSDTEGGTAKLTFVLVVSGESFPNVFEDTATKTAALADVAQTTIEETTTLTVEGAISDVRTSILGAVGTALSTITKASGKVSAVLGVLDETAFLADALAEEAGQLLDTPQVLIRDLINVIDSVTDLVRNFIPIPVPDGVIVLEPKSVSILLEAFVDIASYTTTPTTLPTTTAQSSIEETGHDAIQTAVQGGMLASTVRVLTELELESADEALRFQQLFVDTFDILLSSETLPIEDFEALSALKGATIANLVLVQQNLPIVSAHTPQQTLPALVIAYQLYGDANRDQDIIERNRIEQPNFVSGGQALEVLADV